jgi:hypothetical protein
VTTIDDVTLRVIDALNACGADYMLVGSFSSNAYGIPRSTKDADFVLQLHGEFPKKFYEKLGNDFEIDPQLKFETNTGTFKQEMRFTGTPFTVELFRLSDDPFDQQRFRRRVPVKLLGRETFIPTAEDVVIMKTRWLRDKDRPDIKNVLTVQRGKLDWTYIEEWCRTHGTLARLDEIRRTVPDI